MFKKFDKIFKKQVPLSSALIVLTLVLFSVSVIAWTGSGTVDHLARTMYAKYIKASMHGGTADKWLTIGETTARTGVTVVGQVKLSGSTIYGMRIGSTELSGTTGIGYTISGPDQGNIFYIGDTSIVGGGGQTGDSTVGGGSTDYLARSGITVHLPNPITEGMNDWEFTIVNMRSGTSEIVPLAASTASGDISGVTFIGMSDPASLASGVTPGSAISGVTVNSYGESITFIAKYRSSSDMSGNTSHYLIKDYKVAIN